MNTRFFAYLNRMKYIERWGLMHSTRKENISEHSQNTAVIAHALAIIENEIFGGSVDEYKTLFYAVYHETSEVLTGDLPLRPCARWFASMQKSVTPIRIWRAMHTKSFYPCFPKRFPLATPPF